MSAWFHAGNGLKLWEEAYAPFNLVPRPAGSTGVQMGGWFNKEMNSASDFKGLKMRIPGLGGDVLAKLGALATLPLPNSMRPLTVDQVRMLQRPNVVSDAAVKEGRTLAAFGIDRPHTMAAIVPGYLERFQPHGQFAHYRG